MGTVVALGNGIVAALFVVSGAYVARNPGVAQAFGGWSIYSSRQRPPGGEEAQEAMLKFYRAMGWGLVVVGVFWAFLALGQL